MYLNTFQMDLGEKTEIWMKEIAEVRKEMFPKVLEVQKQLLKRETEVLIEWTKSIGKIKNSRSSSEIRTETKSLAPLLDTLKNEPFAPPKINADEIIEAINALTSHKV